MNRKFVQIGAAALLMLIAPTHAALRADPVVTVDPTIQYGAWEGWGTSLAWWAKVVGGFPEPARSDYMTKAFDPVKGLGLNVVRYNIGGGENPLYQAPNKETLSFRAAVPGYRSTPGGAWDWAADANQRWVLKSAMLHGANQLEAFSNSPPWWATVSGSVSGGRGGADNLRPDSDRAFTDYLAEVVRHFHDSWDITFRDVEPLNEPAAGWWTFRGNGNQQEGCRIDPVHQNAVVKSMSISLAARHMAYSPVAASDENSVDAANETTRHYDAAALAGLSQINTHTYGGNDRTRLFNFASSAGKKLWMSEYGDGDASGMQLSRQILTDVKGLHPSAWVYWQVVDGGGWGMLTNPEKDETTTAYGINEKYYVMGQYSRFIRPGAVLIANDDPNTLTAADPRTKSLVLVVTNSSDTVRLATYDLSRAMRLGTVATGTRTSATQTWATLPAVRLTGKSLSVTLPPKSVTSYVISGEVPSSQSGFSYRAYYRLINADSGRPLRSGSNQQWGLVGLGNGLYQIVSRASGEALDVSTALKTPGAQVIGYAYNGGANQMWRPVTGKDGTFTFLNKNSGQALSMNKMGDLTQETPDGAAGTRWSVVQTKTSD